jgi:cytochrome c553
MGMGKARLWGRRVVLAMAAAGVLLAAGYGYAYLFTERLLTGDTLTTLPALAPGDAVEGARLARVLGCTACHGASLEGLVFIEIPHVARLVAPNLTVVRDHYDDAAFVRLMRAGTKFDGRIPLAMPNKVHQRFTDSQVADMLAYLRAAPRVDEEPAPTVLRPLGRVAVALGEYDLSDIRAEPSESPQVLADRHHPDPSRQLLQAACGECHGLDLSGYPDEGIPPLAVVKAYTPEEFARLLREGITNAGTESATGRMSRVARHRFKSLTDDEIIGMKAWLDQ